MTTDTQSPQERIAALREKAERRFREAEEARLAAEREARRQNERRQQCIAHAELLASAVKDLNGLAPWAPEKPYELKVWTNVPTRGDALVGMQLFSLDGPTRNVISLLVDFPQDDPDQEEPIFWISRSGKYPPASSEKPFSERLSFAHAVDRFVFAAEELFEEEPPEDEVPF